MVSSYVYLWLLFNCPEAQKKSGPRTRQKFRMSYGLSGQRLGQRMASSNVSSGRGNEREILGKRSLILTYFNGLPPISLKMGSCRRCTHYAYKKKRFFSSKTFGFVSINRNKLEVKRRSFLKLKSRKKSAYTLIHSTLVELLVLLSVKIEKKWTFLRTSNDVGLSLYNSY